MSNLSKFPCRPWSRVGKIWKCKISTFIWISDRSSIIVYKDVKYHRRPCSGQPLKFAVSNSALVAHFSKRSIAPPWHIGHTQTNIAEFDPMPTKFWFTMAQSNREVAIITVVDRTVALKSIARCSITQTPNRTVESLVMTRSINGRDLTSIPGLISLHCVPTTLLFPFNNCTWKLSFRHTA